MKKCTMRGCRRLLLVCEDCDRTVSTITRTETPAEDEWYPIDKFPPGHDEPCEYRISVTCKGWYRPNGDEPRFASDERKEPDAKFVEWRPWKEGENFQDAVRLMREFREKMRESDVN